MGREEIIKFWNYINDCLRKFEGGRKVLLMGDMNTKVENSEMAQVVGK